MLKKELNQFLENLAKSVNFPISEIEFIIIDAESEGTFTLEEFLNHYNPLERSKGEFKIFCNIYKKKENGSRSFISSFSLSDHFTCGGILNLYNVFVDDNFKRKGIGTLITNFSQKLSEYYGYNMILASTNANSKICNILEKQNWEVLRKFNNPRNKNQVLTLYAKMNNL
jgi:GNAT superfamily N-acetyltransferase